MISRRLLGRLQSSLLEAFWQRKILFSISVTIFTPSAEKSRPIASVLVRKKSRFPVWVISFAVYFRARESQKDFPHVWVNFSPDDTAKKMKNFTDDFGFVTIFRFSSWRNIIMWSSHASDAHSTWQTADERFNLSERDRTSFLLIDQTSSFFGNRPRISINDFT